LSTSKLSFLFSLLINYWRDILIGNGPYPLICSGKSHTLPSSFKSFRASKYSTEIFERNELLSIY